MAFGGSQRKEFKNASDGYKRIPHNRNNYEDGMKLEPRIFKRRAKIKRNSSPVFRCLERRRELS